MVSEKVYKNVMKYLVSGLSSRIQKYQKYISLLKAYEKKSNSLCSDSAFFSYNAKNYTQVLLQILSSNPEPDISDISPTFSHTSLLSFSPHIVNIKSWLAGRGVCRSVCSVRRPAVREKEKNWDFL